MNRSLLLALLLLVPCAVAAQEDVLRPTVEPPPFSVAFELGLGSSMFGSDVSIGASDTLETPNRAYSAGGGTAPVIAITLDYAIGRTLGLRVRSEYASRSYGRTYVSRLDCIDKDRVYMGTFDVATEYETAVSTLGFSALVRYQATPEVFITAGPTVAFLLDSIRRTTSYRLPEDANCGWPDPATGRNTLKTHSETVTDTGAVSTRVGLEAAVGYRWRVNRRLSLSPQLRFQYMITRPMEDRSQEDWWRVTGQRQVASFSGASLHALGLVVAVEWRL